MNTNKRIARNRIWSFLMTLVLILQVFSVIPAKEVKADPNAVNEGEVKYAVSVYGIAQGVDEDGFPTGLTFGPALGANYIQSYHSHTASGTTTRGNAKRCVHNDDWETIVYWNTVDPYVYQDCIAEGCTHTVGLDLPSGFNIKAQDMFKYANYSTKVTGDGPSVLYNELLSSTGDEYQHLRWNPINNGSSYGTNKDGWGATRIRAMLNGADDLTMLKGSYSYYNDLNLSDAENYTENNCLLAAFPTVLRENIVKQAIKYDSVYNSKTPTNLKTSYDKLWLLSPNEIWSTAQNTSSYYTHPQEGTQYPYFSAKTNITSSTSSQEGTKGYYVNGSSGSAGSWWLRSSNGNGANSALCVYNSGNCNGNYACSSLGVSPCFSLAGVDPGHIKVQFDPNKGTITQRTVLADTGEDGGTNKVLPALVPATPARPGYIFTGWDVKSHKSDIATSEPATFPADSEEIDLESIDASEYEGGLKELGGTIKLYARWDLAPQYKIEYYNQSMTLGNDYYQAELPVYEYATSHNQEITQELKDSYVKEYDGFYLDHITPTGDTILDDNSTVIRYYYNRTRFTVRFNGNGSTSGTMEDQAFIGDITQRLYDNRFEKENAVFVEWNTKADGSGTAYGDAQAVKNLAGHEETATLYAQWQDIGAEPITPTDNKFTVKLKSDETVMIPNLPAGTKYTIREVDNPNGWSKSDEVNTDGTIEADTETDAEVTNTYTASGSVSLIAYKTMNIGEPEAGAYTFELLNKNNQVIQTKTNGEIDNVEEVQSDTAEEMVKNPYYGMSTVRFDEIEYTSVGSYTYKIREVAGSEEDIEYDSHIEEVTVNVTDNGDGTLSCKTTYDSDGAVFTNNKVPVFETESVGGLRISKEVSNSDTDMSFPFKVTLTDEAGTELRDTYSYDVVKSDHADHYKEGGIQNITAYSYTQNLNADGGKQSNYGNSWSNSNIRGTGRESASSDAHVVTIEGADSLHVKIVYGGESNSYDWACVWQGAHPNYTANSNYSSSVSGKLGGGSYTSASNTKEYDIPGDSVTFSYRSDGSACGDGYGYYAVITAEVDTRHAITSETKAAYSYTKNLNEAGEQQSDYGDNWSSLDIRGTDRAEASGQAHVVKIDGAESLHVSITYGGESSESDWMCMWEGEYPNYTAKDNYETSVTNKLGGGNHTDATNTKEYDVQGDVVTFAYTSNSSEHGDGYGYYAVVTAEVPTEYYDRSGEITSGGTIYLKSGQTAVIENLPAGVRYTVEEIEGTGYELINSGHTTGTVPENSYTTASFTNMYIADTSAEIIMHKTLIGGELEEGVFVFELLDETETAIQTKVNDADGNIIFDPIDYTQDDAGKEFHYSVREVMGNDESIVYDEHIEDVTVTVTDNRDGTISTNVAYAGEKEFVNSGTSSIQVSKTVSGSMGDRSKAFRFKLILGEGYDRSEITYKKTAQDGTETEGTVTTNDYDFTLAHGDTIVFDNVSRNITYDIVETDANKAGYTTTATGDGSEITKTADGKVHATGTIGDPKSVAFTNVRNMAVPTTAESVVRYVVPLILIVGCGIVIATRKRKNKENN